MKVITLDRKVPLLQHEEMARAIGAALGIKLVKDVPEDTVHGHFEGNGNTLTIVLYEDGDTFDRGEGVKKAYPDLLAASFTITKAALDTAAAGVSL